MNLARLFETQKALDERILKQQGLTEIPLNNMILAVIVELGEMSNDWGGFKHWKVNNQPKEGLLEEVADVFSFLLAIGNMRFDTENIFIYENDKWSRRAIEKGITPQILALISDILEIKGGWMGEAEYSTIVTRFIFLTESLGFTREQVSDAYMSKNAENHRRQQNGY